MYQRKSLLGGNREGKDSVSNLAQVSYLIVVFPCPEPGEVHQQRQHQARDGGDRDGRDKKKKLKLSLKCQIKVCSWDRHEAPFCVNEDAYNNRRRSRRRLSTKKDSDDLSQSHVQGTTSQQCHQDKPVCKPPLLDAASPNTNPEVDGRGSSKVSGTDCTSRQAYRLSTLWTDVYQPLRSSEVMGNGSSVHRLHLWMQAWKKKIEKSCDSEVEGAKIADVHRGPKFGDVAAPKKRRHDDVGDCCEWESEEEDFISAARMKRRKRALPRLPDSSDSEYEGHRERGGGGGGDSGEEGEGDELVPVMVVCGREGSGKTSSVYACANELGYNVSLSRVYCKEIQCLSFPLSLPPSLPPSLPSLPPLPPPSLPPSFLPSHYPLHHPHHPSLPPSPHVYLRSLK